MRPAEVFSWYDWEISLLAQFFAKDPGPDRRIERLLARAVAMYANQGKGSKTAADFLQFDNVWKKDETQSMGALASTFGKFKIAKPKRD